MSTEDFSKKSDKLRKELNVLRKDINYRDEQEKRGQATYTLDAQINGQFNTITQTLSTIQMMVNNFRNNFKDYNLTVSQANKRYKVYEQLLNQKNTLKRNYDALFQKKTTQREIFAAQTHGKDTFDQKYDTKNISNAQLHTIKGKQDDEQEQILDELIQNVRGLKGGQHAIHDELNQHEKLLGTLENKMDGNIDNMSKTRRRVSKLLDKSSNCCLISVMILEIALIVLIWMFL